MANSAINLSRLAVLMRAGGAGLMAGEALALGNIVGEQISGLFSTWLSLYVALNAISIATLVSVGYLSLRGVGFQLRGLFQNGRWDIVLLAMLGFLVSLSEGGLGSLWYMKFARSVVPWTSVVLIAIIVVTLGTLIVQSWITKYSPSTPEGRFFISDNETKTANQDFLGLADRASGFAERVLNEGSSDSLVFGVDAPWGTGKSSFVNFCIEYWGNECETEVVVFKFNPLRYESKANLLEKFIDGVVETLQQSAFVPELGTAVSTYSRHIRAREGLSIGGLKINLFFLSQSLEDAYEALQSVLARSKKKIVVVVDDLDRIPLEQIKDILFTIKVGFPLPNVSYVLCYDTDKVTAGNSAAEDVREFLEKFVNVKISLFLDPNALARYVSDNLESALKDHPHVDPYTRAKIQDAVDALVKICGSTEFHDFRPFIGDIRKIKRLLNTVMLLEIQGVDFVNSDFDKHDLLYLILIYINFPRIFRKIYDTETSGRWGFFSAVSHGEAGYPEGSNSTSETGAGSYRNSVHYTKFLEGLGESQAFLLKKLFEMSDQSFESRFVDEGKKSENASACFNGTHGTSRNLEQYLNLIVRQSKPLRREQQKYYLNKVNEFVGGRSIEEIFQEDEFLFQTGEDSRVRFWRVLVNSRIGVSPGVGGRAISYLTHHLPDYSLLDWKDTKLVGFRDDAGYILAKLLDSFGWGDHSGVRMANTPENIAEIAEWVFGDGRHEGQGVVHILSSPMRGSLGLYDLLVFRLFCCADRGGDIFNLSRAIAHHADVNAPTSGLVREIAVAEMRELSQVVFDIFNNQYIVPGVNLFDSIDAVTLSAITGRYVEYALQQFKLKKVSEDEVKIALDRIRSHMKCFIAYQLGNSLTSSGVGCGYYDIRGNQDSHGIAWAISRYLFDTCFSPERGEQNLCHFVDYAIMNFGSTFGFSSGPSYSFVPSIDELTKVLDRKQLVHYWRKNGERIREATVAHETRQVVTANFSLSYKDAAPHLCDALDALVGEQNS